MKRSYVKKRFRAATLEIIEQANQILEDYRRQGMKVTLRQLYYRFVAKGLLENKQRNYKKLGDTISNARLAGLIDWDLMEDRTRFLRGIGSSTGPGAAVRGLTDRFHLDMWANQPWRVEAWIEKDALIGVLQRPCNQYDVDYFSCRGYTSQTAMHNAARRLIQYLRGGQNVLVLHMSDHDPSGIDMGRDIEDRLDVFSVHYRAEETGTEFKYLRLALTMDQVEEFDPPENPAKLTDPRAKKYVAEWGDSSWELDALEPTYINRLVAKHVREVIDVPVWNDQVDEEREGASLLAQVAAKWGKITKNLDPRKDPFWDRANTWCEKIDEDEDPDGEEGEDPEVEGDF